MKIIMRQIPVTTNASGVAVAESVPVYGLLMRISYKPDASTPLDTGASISLVESQSGLPLYSQAAIGLTAFTKLPRRPISSSIDGTDSTAVFDYIPVADKVTLSVSAGGNVKKGTFYMVWGES